jgi:hypothetical protein
MPGGRSCSSLFGLINGMSNALGCAEIETGSVTTSAGNACTWILGNAIVCVRNRHLPGCLVNYAAAFRRGTGRRTRPIRPAGAAAKS